MGFAFITKLISGVIVPVLVLYLLTTGPFRRAVRDGFLFFLPLLLAFFFIKLWHNDLRYGSPWEFGYMTGWDRLGFSTPWYVGLWGLFLSPGKSFFLYSPVVLLALKSCYPFFLKRRGEALLFFGLMVVYVLPHALWWAWAGDWAWGPRFLLILTPYFVLFCGPYFEEWDRRPRWSRAGVILLIAFSLSVQILGVAIHPFSYCEARGEVVRTLLSPNLPDHTYASAYSENALIHFSPMFSHLVGNWWLFKHMLFSYDLWSDAPWKILGHHALRPPIWVDTNWTIPFWWPVGLPILSGVSLSWIGVLALANVFVAAWWGLALWRVLKRENEIVRSCLLRG